MKHSKKHSTSDRSIEKKFRNVQNTQEGIQSLTVWAIHHQDHAERIVSIWTKIFVESESPHTLTLMYVCNDIVQNCKRKNAVVYKEHFRQHLPDALAHMSKDDSVIPPVQRIFKIWTERLVFEETVISELQDSLITDEFRDKVQQEEIDKKLLAEFKPNKVVESLRSFRRLELDADLKYRQISNLRLDLTNSEAIKQLKDRAHGSEYTRQFEEHSKHLEEFKGDLLKVMQERTALIELLELTEHFYELQYGEALVVANAYKNFGLRVTKQETQLEEIMKPYSGSNAMESPACSPPHTSGNVPQVIDMEMSDDERGEDDEPPVEPYSPSMMESPDRPIGSPISPNTSLTDLDIVKGVAQPYDPTETLVSFDRRSLLEHVYNPKAILDSRSNDISTRLQNLLPAQQANTSFNTDGDGTPTQDEYMDSDKPHATEEDTSSRKDASNEDDWDLAYEFLEENMETSNSGAVSISNLTTIQPTTDFTALTKNTMSVPAPKGVLKNSTSLPDGAKHGRHGSMSLSTNQNGSHSSANSPALMTMASPTSHPSSLNLASAITAAVTAGLARSNSEPLAVPEEDPNAKAQREFLERLTKRGPFKPSRFLQKLTEEKKKPAESAPENSGQYGHSGSQDGGPPGPPSLPQFRPKIEYRSGDCPAGDSVTIVPTGQQGQSGGMLERRIPPIQHGGAPPPQFPVSSPIKLGDPGMPSFPPTPDFPGEFSPMDQDMRQFNPARPPPPPPPPPPRPYMNNVPNAPGPPGVFPGPRGGKQFPGGPSPPRPEFPGGPPPPRPDFPGGPPPPRPEFPGGPPPRPEFPGGPPPPRPEFPYRRMGPNNSRMDSPHPTWSGVPPPGPPPPFFRPRFSGFE